MISLSFRQQIGARQSGMSLFPALMFLLVLTVLGVSALNSALMQEKMVANAKDLNLAFQSAEAALRDAEADVQRPNFSVAASFSPACANGLCTPITGDISKAIDWSSSAVTRGYGSQTGAPALPVVAAQPRYVIEKLQALSDSGVGKSVGIGLGATGTGTVGAWYRLTALGVGTRPETRVILQSTFVVKTS
ncbi:MAG TPA: PilX N-terminal domain-containing pilus assembly protein [Casimicrobiaceae bacterium]|nr:PilX N-terminal domain-containing pilus assembly protein [Casimicrobiaceae bacterium]